ncbi:MAG: TerB family tellurite resistance protein [Planctomycetota bacterium]|jgi:DnaJ like chaperone protein
MGIFGTIFGGTLGFLVGGPLGAVLGGALGSNLSGETSSFGGSSIGGSGGTTRARTPRDMQMVFALALTSLAAKVAKADGKVTQKEIQTFDAFLSQSLRLSTEDRRLAARVFNEARDSSTSVGDFTRQIRDLFRAEPHRLSDIVTILLTVALADGHLHPQEEQLIRQIARDFRMTDADYQACKATFAAATGKSTTSAYEVLGVAPEASDSEVRTAHRKLVREYHPDTLQSKGLPEEFMDFAKEKMTAINDAWARVKTEREI